MQEQWTVEYDEGKNLVIVLPATREVGLFLKRAYFRLMNLPEEQKVTIILIESKYTRFRKNDLGYLEDDYKYVSRAYALAARLANDKISIEIVDGNSFRVNRSRGNPLKRHISSKHRNSNILAFGLPDILYPVQYIDMVVELLDLKSTTGGKFLGAYIVGSGDKGLKMKLIGDRDDLEEMRDSSFDDSLQTQLGVSNLMFTLMNKWISGVSLSSKEISLDLATGNIKLEL